MNATVKLHMPWGTEEYWQSQVNALKADLKEAETLTNLHREKEGKIRDKLSAANTYLNNVKKGSN